MTIKILTYICLYVSEMRTAIHFYRDVLGLEPTKDSDGHDTTFYSFKTGQTTLALEPKGSKKEELKTKAENPYLLQFTVSSQRELEDFNIHLEKHGVTIFDRSKKTNYGYITNFADPDGNKLEVMCF